MNVKEGGGEPLMVLSDIFIGRGGEVFLLNIIDGAVTGNSALYKMAILVALFAKMGR